MSYYKRPLRPDELMHHGVKGQKWGIQNGPPYPLSSDISTGVSLKPDNTNKYMKTVSDLYDDLDKWDYGALINGKKITGDDYYKIDFSKDYKTTPVKKLEKEKIGNCWDFVNYQHYIFDKAGIPNKTYMFVSKRSDKPDDIITHTFSMINVGGKNYWFEQAFYKNRGIHEVDGYSDIVKQLKKDYNLKNNDIDLFEYNPTDMDKGLSDTEYFDKATSGEPVWQQKKK